MLCLSGSSNNNDAIMLLLAEIRSLREQLETSIKSNNSLREMLQKQLTSSPQRQTQVPARSPEHSTLRNSPNVSPGKSTVLMKCKAILCLWYRFASQWRSEPTNFFMLCKCFIIGKIHFFRNVLFLH